MVGEDVVYKILDYLEKKGPTNTFRLASVIGMERDQLIKVLKRLEEKQAIRFEYGNALFLKFISEEKPKPIEPRPTETAKVFSALPKRVKRKSKALQFLQTENAQLQRKLSKLKETVTELERKARAHPKTITRTITKIVVKKVPVTKTIIKKVPAIKTVVKRIHLSLRKKKKNGKKPIVKKKFKLPSFKLLKFTFMKNIKQLKEPEFAK